jgi:hypothetical protein
MSSATAKLISEYERLAPAEKEEFARELFQRLPPVDSGPLDDDLIARAGDEMAAVLENEEKGNDTKSR